MDLQLSPDKKIEDLMLGGLKIIQSSKLYRFTSDAVLLAKFPEKRHKNVLDLCAGSGIVGLHYYGEFSPSTVTFVEIQKELSDMCYESLVLNGLTDRMRVVNIDLKDFDGNTEYDACFCNPPYQKQNCGYSTVNEHIAICREEVKCTLYDIVAAASKALKNGGRFYIVHKAERLNDLFLIFEHFNLSPVRCRFITGRGKTKPYLLLCEAVKGKTPPLKIEVSYENNATDFKG